MLPGTGAGDKSSSRSALARRTPSLGGAPDGLARARRRRAQTEGCTSGGTGPEKVPHMQAARCFSSAPVKRALAVTAWQVARRGHQSLVTALGTPGAHVTTVTARGSALPGTSGAFTGVCPPATLTGGLLLPPPWCPGSGGTSGCPRTPRAASAQIHRPSAAGV